MINPSLNIPQAEFLAMPHKFKAFVAGFGSGKTWAGCSGLAKHFWEHPNISAGYFAPTYPQIRDIFYPTVEECFYDWGLSVEIRESNKEVHVFEGKKYRGVILCRSMDKPSSIVGFKIGHALVDEIDTMADQKAEGAWNKIIARMRYNVVGLRNGIDVTTTPEGYKFVYRQFKKLPRDKPQLANSYGLIHASTYDNEANLPSDYIQSFIDAYPDQLILAYLNGQFANLTAGTVYREYSPKLNNATVEWDGKEALHIGMDFNVTQMAAVIHVVRQGQVYAVDEITQRLDTPDMIQAIKERYCEYKDGDYRKRSEIRIYPDASGDSRKSANASTTDLAEVRRAGFSVHAPSANPPVRDRINAMNAAFHNAKGERRYFVNAEKCRTYSECLQQQVYKSGEPDKTQGLDHCNDAAGYFIYQQLPIVKPTASLKGLSNL